RDVFAHQSVAELAAVASPVAGGAVRAGASGLGRVPATPIMAWLDSLGSPYDRFNQSMLLQVPAGLTQPVLAEALQRLVDHHDLLRARLVHDDAGLGLQVPPAGALEAGSLLSRVEVSGLGPDELSAVLCAEAAASAGRLAPSAGVMAQLVHFDAGAEAPGRLGIMVHHLVVDGVSWRILLPDLIAAVASVMSGQPVVLESVGTSFKQWSEVLCSEAASPSRVAELSLWQAMAPTPGEAPIGSWARAAATPGGTHEVAEAGTTGSLTASLSSSVTQALLTTVPAAFHGGVNDVLLAGLSAAVAEWRQRRGGRASDPVVVEVEGHGREEIAAGVELSRTLGWFTSMFPVALPGLACPFGELAGGQAGAGRAVTAVKELLAALPDHGIGYGLLAYANPQTAAMLTALPAPQIGFNYLGRFPGPGAPAAGLGQEGWAMAAEGYSSALDRPLTHVVEVNAAVADGTEGPVLTASWGWAGELLDEEAVAELAGLWFAALSGIAAHAARPGVGGHSPSDFALIDLTQADIAALEAAGARRAVSPELPPDVTADPHVGGVSFLEDQ
ncbi:MAG: condensation domain-containing protein, partial [Actinomycetota bacterium]